jgi:hypothetical protein
MTKPKAIEFIEDVTITKDGFEYRIPKAARGILEFDSLTGKPVRVTLTNSKGTSSVPIGCLPKPSREDNYWSACYSFNDLPSGAYRILLP